MIGKEALKEYKEIYIDKTFKGDSCPSQEWYLEIIEQDLDKLEELEKVIEIIKNKDVDNITYLLNTDLEDYNQTISFFGGTNILTQEEYELLKDVFENE